MLAAVEVAGDVSGVVGATVGGSVDAGALIGSLVGATVVTTTAVVVPAGVDDFWHSGNRVIHCWHSVSFFAHRARQQYKLHGFSSSAIHASPPSAHSFARSAVTVDASHITASPASDRVPSVRIASMASAIRLWQQALSTLFGDRLCGSKVALAALVLLLRVRCRSD